MLTRGALQAVATSPMVEIISASSQRGPLYLGNIVDALNSNCQNILNISTYTHAQVQSVWKGGVLPTGNVLQISIEDDPNVNLMQYFDITFDFIHKARSQGQSVLVHCVAGVSRSPTVVCAYLMKLANLSASDALSLVKRKRNIVDPNIGFIAQLYQYENRV